jgi:hypothetical protein
MRGEVEGPCVAARNLARMFDGKDRRAAHVRPPAGRGVHGGQPHGLR